MLLLLFSNDPRTIVVVDVDVDRGGTRRVGRIGGRFAVRTLLDVDFDVFDVFVGRRHW